MPERDRDRYRGRRATTTEWELARKRREETFSRIAIGALILSLVALVIACLYTLHAFKII